MVDASERGVIVRGPESIRQRMAELQARIDALSPPKSAPNFSDQLQQATSSPLQGQIGGGGGMVSPADPAELGVVGEGDLRAMATQAAQRHGVDPSLFHALVETESGFDPWARSKADAVGLAQLMPETAAELGVDRFDPAQNLDGGAKYLAKLMKQFPDPRLALAAYNAGPRAVKEAGGIPQNGETPAYVQRILAKVNGGR